MNITIQLQAGHNRREPTKKDMQKNINALERAAKGKPLGTDLILIRDTQSIMSAIQKQIPR
jgi:hypothetical protein